MHSGLNKARIVLGDDLSLYDKKINFLNHNELYEPVLKELQQKTAEKLAKTHLSSWLGTGEFWWNKLDSSVTCEKDFLTIWREKEVTRLMSFSRVSSDSSKTYEKFLTLREDLPCQLNVSDLQKTMANIGSEITECFRLSSSCFFNIEQLDFYSEMIVRFSTLFTHLTPLDHSFLLFFAEYDEKGLLLLCHRLLYCVLKSVLASQLIIALYKPGAFVTFLEKALQATQGVNNHLRLSNIITVSNVKAVKILSFTGLTLGLTLYSNIFSKKSMELTYHVATYSGFSGLLGNYTELLRSYGSMLVFEAAKTCSTLSNAALAGFIEPKEAVLRNFLTEWRKK